MKIKLGDTPFNFERLHAELQAAGVPVVALNSDAYLDLPDEADQKAIDRARAVWAAHNPDQLTPVQTGRAAAKTAFEAGRAELLDHIAHLDARYQAIIAGGAITRQDQVDTMRLLLWVLRARLLDSEPEAVPVKTQPRTEEEIEARRQSR